MIGVSSQHILCQVRFEIWFKNHTRTIKRNILIIQRVFVPLRPPTSNIVIEVVIIGMTRKKGNMIITHS